MSSTISSVEARDWHKDDGTTVTVYWIGLDGEKELPCYDAAGAELKLNTPLPEGWARAESKAGKPYLKAPKRGGGGGGKGFQAAWANTEPGERFVQERMDRRTALMQAVAISGGGTARNVTTWADALYAWLQDGTTPRPTLVPKPELDAKVMMGPAAVKLGTFPVDVVDAEVAWKDNTVIPVTEPAKGGATAPQMSKLHLLAKELGWDDERRHLEAGVESFTHLTKPQASELIERWSAWKDSAEGEAILGSSSGGGPRTEPSADTTSGSSAIRQAAADSGRPDTTSSGGGAHGESPADSIAARKATAPPEGPPNATQWSRAEGLLGTKARILNLAHARFGITELEQLTKAQLAELIEHPK